MDTLNWDDLRFFRAVAQAGSLQGAARALEVNHSTVFRRINRFEAAIGARLFERLAAGYQLTQAGEELITHTERMGDEVDRLLLRVAGKDFRPSGTIRITAPDNLAYCYLPEYLRNFGQEYPDIDIELVVSNEDFDLSRREADLAVRATSRPPERLIGRKVFSLVWAFYASRNYLDSHGAPRTQADLGGHGLVGAEGSISRLPAMRWIERQASRITVRCSNLMAMAAMARADRAIALLPDDQIQPELERLFAVEPQITSDIWLLTHPELRRTERIRLLLGHLFEHFRRDERLIDLAIT